MRLVPVRADAFSSDVLEKHLRVVLSGSTKGQLQLYSLRDPVASIVRDASAYQVWFTDNDEPVAFSYLCTDDKECGHARGGTRVGYFVAAAHRRRGVATRIVAFLVGWGGQHGINATVDVRNVGSFRALRNNGFEPTALTCEKCCRGTYLMMHRRCTEMVNTEP